LITQSIGVHVRNTDLKPTRTIIQLIDLIQQRHPSETIFLATDSVQVEELFKSKFNNIILPKRELNSNEEAIHKTERTASNFESSRQDFEYSLRDMWFLSQCKTLYYQGNSSFSIIAKNMGNNNSYDWLTI